eukprot:29037-Eustigmatos_ZCMA.PRE.1
MRVAEADVDKARSRGTMRVSSCLIEQPMTLRLIQDHIHRTTSAPGSPPFFVSLPDTVVTTQYRAHRCDGPLDRDIHKFSQSDSSTRTGRSDVLLRCFMLALQMLALWHREVPQDTSTQIHKHDT